ncbi:MAG TPA: hypothetical protein VNJ01_17885 [Bacteriovoracaceae bacterium]|nr:hypothetical protein [Bacteriovoracaceae bacterium]
MKLFSWLIFILFHFHLGSLQAQSSHPLDLMYNSCETWQPGFAASCTTCESRVCPKGVKKCQQAEKICSTSSSCNTWAKGVCKSWQNWCRTNVIQSPSKGTKLEKKFRPYVRTCQQYIKRELKFVTNLTDSMEMSEDSSLAPMPGTSATQPVAPPALSLKTEGANPAATGPSMNQTGSGGLGQYCEEAREDCEETLLDPVGDSVSLLELKKQVYTKSVERLLRGARAFEDFIGVTGAENSKPSAALLNHACCEALNDEDDQGCLSGWSVPPGSLSVDTKLRSDWKPSWCDGLQNPCQDARKSSTAISEMDVTALTLKLSTYAAELSSSLTRVTSAFAELPYVFRTKNCPERPQAKFENPCPESSPAEAATAIVSSGSQDPRAQAFLKHFNNFSSRHKLLGTMPYVLLLTGPYKDVFTGKVLSDQQRAKASIPKMAVSADGVRSAIAAFGPELASKAICSMKRLYSGRVRGTEDLNGIDDCTSGANSDANRALLASFLRAPGIENEIPLLKQNNAKVLLCRIYSSTSECQQKWKSLEPYTGPLKVAANLAMIPLSFVVPELTIPYFYATAAIDVGIAYSDYEKAVSGQEQFLVGLLKNEVSTEEYYLKLADGELKIKEAQLGIFFSAVFAAMEIGPAHLLKNLAVRMKGPKTAQKELVRLIAQGDEEALRTFMKNNPALEVQVLDEAGKTLADSKNFLPGFLKKSAPDRIRLDADSSLQKKATMIVKENLTKVRKDSSSAAYKKDVEEIAKMYKQNPDAAPLFNFQKNVERMLSDLPENEQKIIKQILKNRYSVNERNTVNGAFYPSNSGLSITVDIPKQFVGTEVEYFVKLHETHHLMNHLRTFETLKPSTLKKIEQIKNSVKSRYFDEAGAMAREWQYLNAIPPEVRARILREIESAPKLDSDAKDLLRRVLTTDSKTASGHILREHKGGRYAKKDFQSLVSRKNPGGSDLPKAVAGSATMAAMYYTYCRYMAPESEFFKRLCLFEPAAVEVTPPPR